MKGPGKEKIEGKVKKTAGKLEDKDKECREIGARPRWKRTVNGLEKVEER
jgi:hypothetical protein